LLNRASLSDPSSWTLQRLWTSGHVGVVRSCLWDESNNILVTGGEDAKLNVWASPAFGTTFVQDSSPAKRESDSSDMDVDEELGSPFRKRRRA